MPWNNQSGGPWGNGNRGPWGSGPQGGGSGGREPPDLETLLRRGQDRLRGVFPGGAMGGRGIAIIAVIVVLVWLFTGVYTVRPNEVGINLIFGRYTGQTSEGLNYNLPYPIGSVLKPNITANNTISVGYQPGGGQGTRQRDVTTESLMLTGDENIVDLKFDVQWRVNPARVQDYVFNLQNPDGTIKAVAESAMREVIGRRNIQAILTTEQASIANEVKDIMQQTLDAYRAGVLISIVQLQQVSPPAQVREAFFDVNAAQQDAVRVQNEAETFASRVVPEARGRAVQTVQQAEAYQQQALNEATGQASRFSQVYEEYKKSPDIIRERIYLETMERVFGGVDKVIIDQNGQGGGVVPYLPLGEAQRRTTAPSSQRPGDVR